MNNLYFLLYDNEFGNFNIKLASVVLGDNLSLAVLRKGYMDTPIFIGTENECKEMMRSMLDGDPTFQLAKSEL